MKIKKLLKSSTILQGKVIIHKYNDKTEQFDELYSGMGLNGRKIPDNVKGMKIAYMYAEGEYLTLEVE